MPPRRSPEAVDLMRSVRGATAAVNTVMRGFRDSVLTILERWRRVGLTPVARRAIVRDIDALIGRVFGATRQAALVSDLFTTIVKATDAAATRPVARMVSRVERIAERRSPGFLARLAAFRRDDPIAIAADVARGLRSPADLSPALNPQRRWVSPRGYRLSDRVWAAGRAIRRTVTRIVRREPTVPAMSRAIGESAKGGIPGANRARVLAQMEVTRIHNAAVVEANRIINVRAFAYRLSNVHIGLDACDGYADHDEGLGRGVYLRSVLPMPPVHIGCGCRIEPVSVPDGVIAAYIAERYGGVAA